jgi:hypothetical protein
LSSIAELHIVPTSSLVDLEKAAKEGTYPSVLLAKRMGVIVFQYSGWILATLLPVLDSNYGIRLMNSEKGLATKLSSSVGNSQFIFMQNERDLYDERLDPALFSSSELQRVFEEFNATQADGVGEIMLDGIRFLRAGLQQITPETVTVLTIG